MDMLFYAHGDQGRMLADPKEMPEDSVTKAPFELGNVVDASNRRIALVVPHMDWNHLAKNKLNFVACNRTDASLHALGQPATLNGVLKEVLAEIGRVFGSPAPAVENLILAGHSRAHGFFNVLALMHGCGDAEGRPGVPQGGLVPGFDLLLFHGRMAAVAERLLNLTMSVFHRPGTGTAFKEKNSKRRFPRWGAASSW